VGTSPLVCKRVVVKSRVENTYRSLLAQLSESAQPPKRRNSPSAVAVAVAVSVWEDRGKSGRDSPISGVCADHVQTGCGCWVDCEASPAGGGLKRSSFREDMLLDQMVVKWRPGGALKMSPIRICTAVDSSCEKAVICGKQCSIKSGPLLIWL